MTGALLVESMASETATVSPSFQESPPGSSSYRVALLGVKVKVSDPRVRVRGPLPSRPSEGVVPAVRKTTKKSLPLGAELYLSVAAATVAVPRVKVAGETEPKEGGSRPS